MFMHIWLFILIWFRIKRRTKTWPKRSAPPPGKNSRTRRRDLWPTSTMPIYRDVEYDADLSSWQFLPKLIITLMWLNKGGRLLLLTKHGNSHAKHKCIVHLQSLVHLNRQNAMAQSIDPQAIQQLYRARYPQMTNEQLNQATRAYIMQVIIIQNETIGFFNGLLPVFFKLRFGRRGSHYPTFSMP